MDYALIATAYDAMVRIYVANTTNTVKKIQKIHDTTSIASIALGRFLTVSAMMGFMYKDDERISLKIEADGIIGNMIMETNGKGYIKGDIENPHIDTSLTIKEAVGNGYIKVVKDLNMKNLFTSSSELVSGEIADDFTYYFTVSEQTPSSVAAGVSISKDNEIEAAGGFIIQVLPGCIDEVITIIENVLLEMPPVTTLIKEKLTCEEILSILSCNSENILSKKKIQYFCGCSKKRFQKALSTLNETTLTEIITEDKQAEIVCNFCKKKYIFDEKELKEIRKSNLT